MLCLVTKSNNISTHNKIILFKWTTNPDLPSQRGEFADMCLILDPTQNSPIWENHSPPAPRHTLSSNENVIKIENFL